MSSAFKLLKYKRFGPFFWTQFWGAFNDNLYKNALVILIAFRASSEEEAGFWSNLAAGFFILPFFLFSPLAGQVSDKFNKDKLIRIIKFAEIIIMALGAGALISGDPVFMITVLFLMGAQSAFFGPIKYAILPQTLHSYELVAGNAMVEMGTFLAILLGTIAGGIAAGFNILSAAVGVILFAIIGYISSRRIPLAEASSPQLKITYNFFKELSDIFKISKSIRSVHLSIMGISWFWFYGAAFLSQLPSFTKYFIHGNETVGTFFLAIFSLSIGLGSIACEKLSRGDIELGLVPFGAFGLSLFAFDLYWMDFPSLSTQITLTDFIMQILTSPTSGVGFSLLRIVLDFAMIGIFGSFYTVPLYALVQKRSESGSRSRLIAWLNIQNSVFMVFSAIMGIILYKIGLNTVQIFGVLAVLNFIVALYIFSIIPEFLFRFYLWILANTIYRVRITGRDLIPSSGAALIVANHVSFIDWFIITAACRRPVRFVMDHNYFFMPIIKWFFILAKIIPIAPAKENPEIKEKSFELISRELNDGQLVCIFPEGLISHDGKLNTFRPGVERILTKDRVPIVPISIFGMWGSFFSRHKGQAMKGLPKPTRRKVLVSVGSQHPPSTSAKLLEEHISKMLRDSEHKMHLV